MERIHKHGPFDNEERLKLALENQKTEAWGEVEYFDARTEANSILTTDFLDQEGVPQHLDASTAF